MAITTISSKNFNQYVTDAKKATKDGPVFITVRGKPSHVLLSFGDYRKLTQEHRSIIDALAMPGVEDIEFNAPRSNISVHPADFS